MIINKENSMPRFPDFLNEQSAPEQPLVDRSGARSGSPVKASRFRDAVSFSKQVIDNDDTDNLVDKDDLKVRLGKLKRMSNGDYPYRKWWEMLESANNRQDISEIKRCVEEIEAEAKKPPE
jgi:hypothetical protein